MAADIITENIATIGLMNDAISIRPMSDTDPRPVFLANGTPMAVPALLGKDFYAWLPGADFEETAALLADTLGAAALEYPDTYDAFVEAVSEHGSSGRVLLVPSGMWPDSVASALPWLPGAPPNMRARRFPAIQLLDFISCTPKDVLAPGEEYDTDWLDAWCEENPTVAIRTEDPFIGTLYHGWNAAFSRRAVVYAPIVDFAKPWRIIASPGGGEDIAPAAPLRLADEMFNYYEAVYSPQEKS